MSDDIVDRLRWYADEQDAPRDAYDLTNEAATAIDALTAERDALQAKVDAALAAIRDIDAHATPMGLLHADDPEGSPAYYHLTVGALHRALALTGAAAPCADLPCQRSAALQAKVDAIDALHHKQTAWNYAGSGSWVTGCFTCAGTWPCSTHLALHPEGDTPT